MSESTEPQAIIYAGGQEFTIHQPTLVSVTYTAVYDTGAVVFGAVAHDGGDEPLEVEFRHARGNSSSLP